VGIKDACCDVVDGSSFGHAAGLALRSWRAKWTGAEHGRILPRRWHGHYTKYFVENAPHFGEYVADSAIGGRLRRALENLGSGTGANPALLIRGIFPRPLSGFALPARLASPRNLPLGGYGAKEIAFSHPKGFLRSGRIDVAAAALLSAAGAELRQKNPTDRRVWQDFVTDVHNETYMFHESRDLWQRFRQATPEFAPDDVRKEKVSANILLIACVENTIKDPIYILSVADVLSGLDEATIGELRKKQFEFVDGWTWDLAEINRNLKSIVGGPKDDPRKMWLSFDPNRIDSQSDKTLPEGRKAVGRLMERIHDVGSKAKPVVLKRGDVLMVNNQHAMVRRKERTRFVFTWFMPALRWLRVYYGFPPVPSHQHGGHGAVHQAAGSHH
jgi:hypothetical protein